MCGILFINGSNPESVLKEWAKSLNHRGPDRTGDYLKNNIGMAFTRLSINDPSLLGDQPYHHGDRVIVDSCV